MLIIELPWSGFADLRDLCQEVRFRVVLCFEFLPRVLFLPRAVF